MSPRRKGLGVAVAALAALAAGWSALHQLERAGNLSLARSNAGQIAMGALLYASDHDDVLPGSVEDLIAAGYLERDDYSYGGKPLSGAIEFPRIATPPGAVASDLPPDTVLVRWQCDEDTAVQVTVGGDTSP